MLDFIFKDEKIFENLNKLKEVGKRIAGKVLPDVDASVGQKVIAKTEAPTRIKDVKDRKDIDFVASFLDSYGVSKRGEPVYSHGLEGEYVDYTQADAVVAVRKIAEIGKKEDIKYLEPYKNSEVEIITRDFECYPDGALSKTHTISFKEEIERAINILSEKG